MTHPLLAPVPGTSRMREVFCELGSSVDEMPVEAPFVVQDLAPAAPASAEAPMTNDNPVPSRPVEAARTRDGESDPPQPAG